MQLNFDIFLIAKPKTREDCIILAREILSELDNISLHINKAIEKCKPL